MSAPRSAPRSVAGELVVFATIFGLRLAFFAAGVLAVIALGAAGAGCSSCLGAL
jgi:hypothetical protein